MPCALGLRDVSDGREPYHEQRSAADADAGKRAADQSDQRRSTSSSQQQAHAAPDEEERERDAQQLGGQLFEHGARKHAPAAPPTR